MTSKPPKVLWLSKNMMRYSRAASDAGVELVQSYDLLNAPQYGYGSFFEPSATLLNYIEQYVREQGDNALAIVIGNCIDGGLEIAQHIKDLNFTQKTWVVWNSSPFESEMAPYKDAQLAQYFTTRVNFFEEILAHT